MWKTKQSDSSDMTKMGKISESIIKVIKIEIIND